MDLAVHRHGQHFTGDRRSVTHLSDHKIMVCRRDRRTAVSTTIMTTLFFHGVLAVHIEDHECYKRTIKQHTSHINCMNQRLTGTIPASLFDLELTDVFLSNNELSGTIPSSANFGQLTLLTDFRLDNNQLTGTIPAALGDLAAVTNLGLSRNQLTGPIPKALGKLSQLTQFDITYNKLKGCIPFGLGACAIIDDPEDNCHVKKHPNGDKHAGNKAVQGVCGFEPKAEL